MRHFVLSLYCALITMPVLAGTNIGTDPSHSGLFGTFIKLFQDFVNALEGPLGKGILLISLIIAALLWANAPRSGALAWILRVIVVMIVLINISALLAWLGFGTTGSAPTT